MNQTRKKRFINKAVIGLIVYLVISGVILAFSSGSFLINFKDLGFSIVSSVQKGVHTVTSSIGQFFTAVGELGTLRKEYDLLTEQLANYEYLQRNNADITKENERLKEQLDFSQIYEYTNIPALIIGRDFYALN